MHWDSYTALGLVHTLTPSASGGVEPAQVGDLNADPHTEKSGIPRGFGKIIRDETGDVIQIQESVEADSPISPRPVMEEWIGEMRAKSSGVIKGELLFVHEAAVGPTVDPLNR